MAARLSASSLGLTAMCLIVPARFAQSQTPATATSLFLEAENFTSVTAGCWRAGQWVLGENYFAATFGSGFLSRRAFLGAPETLPAGTDVCVATKAITVPAQGNFAVLVRYEFPGDTQHWRTQFNLTVEQPPGTEKFNIEYGVPGFNGQPGGGGPIWQGIGKGDPPALDMVALEPGPALVKLIATDLSASDAGTALRSTRRNVDVVVLTTNTSEVR